MPADPAPGPASPLRRWADGVARWLEPEDNPTSTVFGTLAVGLLLAAEDPRYGTYPKLMLATSVTIALYWLAHAYAHLLGARLRGTGSWTRGRLAAALWHEWAIVKGAAIPAGVLVVAWGLGAEVPSAVSAAVWASAAAVVTFELAAGVRSGLRPAALVANTLLGASLGCAILGVKLILH